ncbi:unnamed protein product [Vitrella brassicaformis CCMP3155]|uniref:Reverse transcriptase domain-containing protein n=1 Tax=Vitrella brassicaformis (strain CCMP3155) TaxID=1169540 RepID=A0A0G4GKY7_VITBC|nr:unnamed protein product [Vitrella brassicaformis CCMP3155]|eukprot:CEM30702.1 unnamed protein product [Vitrella brassicaformis CCMP3155]
MKAVYMENKLAFEEDFSPLQFAVGTSAGGERLFRACQTFTETRRDDSDKRVLVTLDNKNAFNSFDRQAILDELGTKWPSLVDFFWQFYATPAELWYRMEDGRTATSSEFLDDFIGAFMDDIDGEVDETCVMRYVDRAEQLLAEKKLRLQRDKSTRWSPRRQQDSDIPADIATSDVKCSTEGITVLGCPIGATSFIQRSLKKITIGHQPLLEAIVTFAQMGLQGSDLLLRYCVSPRLNYWLRLLPSNSDVSLAAAERYDAAIITAFRRMFYFPGDFPDSVSAQVQLPIRLGGFGFISATTIVRTAFLGSVGLTASDVSSRFHGPYGCLRVGAALLDLPWLQTAAPAFVAVSEVVGPSFSLPSL